jgi:hypothetical protein
MEIFMKISNTPEIAYAEATRQKTKQAAPGFGDMLAKEVSQGQAAAQAAPIPRANPLGPLLMEPSATERTLDNMNRVLDKWERYAEDLTKTDGATLKDAYAALSDIASSVDDLRKTTLELPGNDAGLKDMVDALDVLAVTETFKFNRGDYS